MNSINFLQKHMERCFSTFNLRCLVDACLFELHVGAVFWVSVNDICVAIYLGHLASNAEVYVKNTFSIM